ncbi:MAG: twin-arginine translocase TatA/TatE family subunit [Acidobacteriota bacterium]
MYLFIFESIGPQELILIGIVALIFFGPRRLPEMAKKLGKVMADFRSTTNEFKATWEREVNFDEEERALKTGSLPPVPVSRTENVTSSQEPAAAPEVRAIGAEEVKARMSIDEAPAEQAETPAKSEINTDKRDWL